MMITFTNRLNIRQSIQLFDSLYEPELQLTQEEKSNLLHVCRNTTTYLFINGTVVGEIYGASPRWLAIEHSEQIEDTNPDDGLTCYCYSCTIIPGFQGLGLGRYLQAYWMGLCKARGYKRVSGHAMSPAMVKLASTFNAQFPVADRPNWQGTQRTARYYEIEL